MKKFYIHNEKSQQGPYSITELKELGITKEIFVWTEGIEDWTRAGNVDELKELFIELSIPEKKLYQQIIIQKRLKKKIFLKIKMTSFLKENGRGIQKVRWMKFFNLVKLISMNIEMHYKI